MAAAWYFLILIGISISAPPEVRNAGIVPAADAMAYCYGSPVFGENNDTWWNLWHHDKLEWFYCGFDPCYLCNGQS